MRQESLDRKEGLAKLEIMNQFYGQGQEFLGNIQHAGAMHNRHRPHQRISNPMNQSVALRKLQSAVGAALCIGGVNHLAAKHLKNGSIEWPSQLNDKSSLVIERLSTPLASMTLAFILAQGGFRERAQIQKQSQKAPRLTIVNRKRNIAHRRFSFHAASPQRVAVAEMKATSILLSGFEGMLEFTTRYVMKHITSFLHQTHQFTKDILRKGLHNTLHFPVGNALGLQSQRIISKSILQGPTKSTSPSDTENFFAIDLPSKYHSGQRALSKALPAPLPGGVTMDLMFDANVQILNSIIFSPKSSFNEEWHKVVNSMEMTEGQWTTEGMRTINYKSPPTMIVRRPINGIERQSYRTVQHGELYVVNVVTTLPNVPMGNTFEIHQQFSLARVNDERCRVQSSWELKFVKGTYLQGIIHSKISSQVHSNSRKFGELLQRSFQDWQHHTSSV